MENITIRTNGRARELVSLSDLPAKIAADFDYIGDDEQFSPRFVQYRKAWYDIGDMTRALECFKGWDCYAGGTYFSGVLVRFVDDGERVIMANYYC